MMLYPYIHPGFFFAPSSVTKGISGRNIKESRSARGWGGGNKNRMSSHCNASESITL